MPFNPDVLTWFRFAYPSRAGTEIESAEPPYPVCRNKTSELGHYDKSSTPEVEPTGLKASLVSGAWWALLIACILASCR